MRLHTPPAAAVVVVASLAAFLGFSPSVGAAVMFTTTHGAEANSLDGSIASGDLLSGLIATELPGDGGWHPVNLDPLDRLPAFTDDAGIRGTGLTGLLSDFPGAGDPAKIIQYDLGGPKSISKIQILSGNQQKDGRIFSTTVINFSSNGSDFNFLGYFQSDPSGTNNDGTLGSTLVEIWDDLDAQLLSDVSHLQFLFYAVGSAGGETRDPFDGLNPFTAVDDGLTAATVSPLIFEIDAIEANITSVPEPATLVLFGFGLVGLGFAARFRTIA